MVTWILAGHEMAIQLSKNIEASVYWGYPSVALILLTAHVIAIQQRKNLNN